MQAPTQTHLNSEIWTVRKDRGGTSARSDDNGHVDVWH